MAETALSVAPGRPSYETADGRFDEDRLREFVEDYDGPGDPDYPGCVPIPMTLEQFDKYEGGVEYWSRERGTALICRDGSPVHEIPGGRLPGLLTRVEQERGSPILCCGALRMVTVDGAGQTAEGMHPDQSVYLRLGAWMPSGRSTVVGRDPRPDVVLEVDNTTDVRRHKLGVYARWGFPEVWVETPDEPTPSRPGRVVPGLTIYVLDRGDYRMSAESVALPTWRAHEIHSALNEAPVSSSTIECLVRVGRTLGDREGTGPMDDAQIAGYMRRSHDVGHRTGFARGLEQGQEAARREALAYAATETLRLRGVPLSEDFDRRLAATTISPQTLLAAAQLGATEADFWARLRGGQPATDESSA